jgi:hypothetical protein
MLWALGLGARVAAVSDACDFPPDVVARAKARRSFAATASWASSLDRHGSSPFASAVASRRESPTCAVALHRGRSSWQNLAHGSSGGSSGASSPTKATAASKAAAGGGGQAASQQQQAQQQAQQRRHQGQHQPGHQQHQVEFVVDEEVLARERPGMVVYEENDAALCASGSASAGAMMGGCGMGQAVLEALMTVGLQQSCRVVCMRRRTLSDVLESMLVVSWCRGRREGGRAGMGNGKVGRRDAETEAGEGSKQAGREAAKVEGRHSLHSRGSSRCTALAGTCRAG